MSGEMVKSNQESEESQRERKIGVITFTDHIEIITHILGNSGLLEKAKQYDGSLEGLAFLMLAAEHVVEFGIAPIKARLTDDAARLFNNYSHFLAGFILAYSAVMAMFKERCSSMDNDVDELLLS